jgi:outer membrane protein insertion porin family
LTDRFFLGEPQFAGFDIRGVGPRVLRTYLTSSANAAQFVGTGIPTNPVNAATLLSPNNHPNSPTTGATSYDTLSTTTTYDALGGRYYYKGRLELEIPLGSGAKELGLRPSIFADVGAVWGVRAPSLINANDRGAGSFFTYTDTDGSVKVYNYAASLGKVNGNQVYQVVDQGLTYTNGGNTLNAYGLTTTCSQGFSTTIGAIYTAANPGPCTSGVTSSTVTTGTPGYNVGTRSVPPFTETFFGDTPRPRLSIGFGVNWNSPFGPFRIDIAKAILKSEGDQTKLFTFNVGTQF